MEAIPIENKLDENQSHGSLEFKSRTSSPKYAMHSLRQLNFASN